MLLATIGQVKCPSQNKRANHWKISAKMRTNKKAITEHRKAVQNRDAARRCSAYAGNADLLGVLKALGVELMFSFSSVLIEFEETLARLGVLICESEPVTDALRSPPIVDGVPGIEERELTDFPSADCALTGGVGVAEIEGRDTFEAGGPIGVLEVLLPVVLPRLARVLLFKAVRLGRGVMEGVPVVFRSEPSLDTSERDDDGRGVEGTEGSRQLEGFGVGILIDPPVPRTPWRRLT